MPKPKPPSPQAQSQRARAQSRPGLSGSPEKAARREVLPLRTLTAATPFFRMLSHVNLSRLGRKVVLNDCDCFSLDPHSAAYQRLGQPPQTDQITATVPAP